MTVDNTNEQQNDQDEFAAKNAEAGEQLDVNQPEITDSLSEQESLQKALEAQTLKAQENMELALRTRAEMENLRKRMLRDIENAHKYALERFVNELLPVLDSLELGIQASETTNEIASLREGMHLTLKKLGDSLEKAGVVALSPAGEKFNPEKHSAVSMTKVDGTESGKVITVLQKGYELNGRLVRPAMVVVSS